MNQPAPEQRLIELIVQIRLDQPDASAITELQALLQDPALRRLYLQFVNLEGHLESLHTQHVQDESAQPLSFDEIAVLLRQAEDAAPDVADRQDLPIDDGINKTTHAELPTLHETASAVSYLLTQQANRYRTQLIGLAAMLLVGVILAIAFMSGSDPLEPDPREIVIEDRPAVVAPASVATLTAARNATWAEGAVAPGSLLQAGDRLNLTAGFAEITTNDGAIAILEAPASVELVDNKNALRLHSGKLVGICETEASQGFVVFTPRMDVTDLGTRFGIHIDPQGDVYTAVLEGEVQLSSNDDSATASTSLTLKAGQAIRDRMGFGLDPVPHDVQPDHAFLPSWDAIRGRVQITGQARFYVQPPKDVSPNALIDHDHLIVFQEQTTQTDAPLRVMTELSRTSPKGAYAVVPEGTRVISYLIHFNPNEFIPGQIRETQNSVASATLTFPGRVLGVIGGGNEMAKTNKRFGLDAVVYENPTLEFEDYNNEVDQWPGDGLTITGENQNTLDIRLSAFVHSDQARVLVEVPAD